MLAPTILVGFWLLAKILAFTKVLSQKKKNTPTSVKLPCVKNTRTFCSTVQSNFGQSHSFAKWMKNSNFLTSFFKNYSNSFTQIRLFTREDFYVRNFKFWQSLVFFVFSFLLFVFFSLLTLSNLFSRFFPLHGREKQTCEEKKTYDTHNEV